MKEWADYLVNNTMPLDGTQYVVFRCSSLLFFDSPFNRTSADAFEMRANLTNLAVKGIIGIRAMSEISRSTRHDGDAHRYIVGAICADEHESPSNFSVDTIFPIRKSLDLIGSIIRRACPFELR